MLPPDGYFDAELNRGPDFVKGTHGTSREMHLVLTFII